MAHNPHTPRIVVGVDTSDESDAALQHAVRLLRFIPHGELHLVHAASSASAHTGASQTPSTVPPNRQGVGGAIVTSAPESSPNPPDAPATPAALRELPRGFWQKLQTIAQQQGVVPTQNEVDLHIRLGAADQAILDVAREVGADEIIVGCHGRTGVKRAVLGSVAEKVVRHADCPVLVARGQGYEKPKEEPEPPRPATEGDSDVLRDDFSYRTRQRVNWTRNNPDTAGVI